MCYYNSVKLKPHEFLQLQEFEIPFPDLPIENVELMNGFDYGMAPVLKKCAEKIELVTMEWGFLPAYIKTRKQAADFRNGYRKASGQWQQPILTLNARGEELLEDNKMYKEAAMQRRCLVLSSGFYEWRHVERISAKTGKPLKTPEKIPYHITVRNCDPFWIAAIWQPWTDVETGEYVETFSIVTTQANELMAQIHNSRRRMPVILTEELARQWLMQPLAVDEIKQIATFRLDSRHMHYHTVSKTFRESSQPKEPVAYSIPDIDN